MKKICVNFDVKLIRIETFQPRGWVKWSFPVTLFNIQSLLQNCDNFEHCMIPAAFIPEKFLVLKLRRKSAPRVKNACSDFCVGLVLWSFSAQHGRVRPDEGAAAAARVERRRVGRPAPRRRTTHVQVEVRSFYMFQHCANFSSSHMKAHARNCTRNRRPSSWSDWMIALLIDWVANSNMSLCVIVWNFCVAQGQIYLAF
jgi:hypothetical protein